MFSTSESKSLLHNFKLLCRDERFQKSFDKFKRKELTEDLVQELKNILVEYLLNPKYTCVIVRYFSKYLLQLLTLGIPLDSDQSNVNSYEIHVNNCVVLSLIAKNHPDANRFMLQYFEKYPSPFNKRFFNDKTIIIPTKKRKTIPELISKQTSDLELVNCCYTFLKISADFFRTKWNWSEFIQKYYNHKDAMVKWISIHCIGIITGMNETQLNKVLEQSFTKDQLLDCTLKYDGIDENFDLYISNSSTVDVCESSLVDNVVSVAGILLPVYQKCSDVQHLVQVKSAQANLRKVALGIAANRAVCLQGPVGSSKTALVEYLAALTGRKLGESFIKVQLGDQTDSKMLLGTYRCTDIPGEFVWQAGVLTQAVTEGSWLLLEDIDSASMDIATVLTSLLENNYLSVPGFRDTVAITPGFQLFVTQRLIASITGFHKKHTNTSTILEKHLLQINIEPLTQDELVEIVKIRYPALQTIATRIVDVFMLFSMGHHESLVTRTTRLTSTRDLFKWCDRAIIDFDIASQNSALKVFQDAIDIFCCALPSIEERLRLAKEISIRLGIIETKADYFCNLYKPNLSLSASNLTAGRTIIQRQSDRLYSKKSKFSFTRPSSCLLERIICCVNLQEPVLLVGETGTGKTSSIQYLAETIGQKLIVINMNQQSDSADLLGGYKPVDFKYVISPIKLQFELLFREYFSVEPNKKFLQHISTCFAANKWSTLLTLMKHSQTAAIKRLQSTKTEDKTVTYIKQWNEIGIKLNKLSVQLKQQSALAFAFIEGSLVKAIENGYWVLLDEINLANAETLECLSGLLEGSKGSLSLIERGDRKPVSRHEKFTLFACMNPSTDVGKKDLPAGLRNRFTEFFVEELTDKSDLILLVNSYLKELSVTKQKIENIVKFYLNIRKEAIVNLSDGLGHKPHYSLRTLCRALTISTKNTCGSVERNLYEAFCLSFLTQLDTNSYKIVEQMIAKAIIGGPKEVKSILKHSILQPKSDHSFIPFEGYWVSQGNLEPEIPKEYFLTESVRKNLKDLVRVVAIGRLPVLLQGDTSVGKTSLITYLAKSSGNKCVRINNHEHTDLQEYIGSYVADTDGKLVFREGVLVEAMRNGHWIILDELNLAPTDVLEALNRVLDDNRELFIPETQETVKAHAGFMLFATQNPPGAYGGRKMLSRAFRNRFVELHFNEIPPNELEIILHKRCEIPPSYCKKMIAVMTDLQVRRRGSAAFAGKQGFITLRDLFRWGERYRLAPHIDGLYDWDQHIADEGYLVLAGRVRKSEERNEIREVLKKHIKRSVEPNNLFTLHDKTSSVTRKILEKIYEKQHLYKNIVWTFNTRQLAVLVGKALEFTEPVLLVGETGGGKTTVCRLIAENNGQKLITVNCHMHTESSDFIGGLRPVREHNEENKNKLFEWVDGPLLQAMQFGEVFLADEISLADDSVLERLNSLLEPERSLLLAEKGTDLSSLTTDSVLVTAHKRFHFIGTMNPGGDFGKKELSPALRNRFTEIWCEACSDRNDFIAIIEHNLTEGLSFGNQEDGSSGIGRSIMDFIEWFRNQEIGKRFTISIRDILTWVHFINTSSQIDISESYIHGACLTFLDSFGSGVTGMESGQSLTKLRGDCIQFLQKQITTNGLNPALIDPKDIQVEIDEFQFGIKPFFLQKGGYIKPIDRFTFTTPTTLFNAQRLLRGLQLNKAILLEGSPGVGKTSLVSALAKITQHKLLRINLSDQTDICDLFGADLPVEGGQGGEFAWRDGPFLQALKNGDWIVLDELNLASQSVLEGLNACLDHRGEIFIPELGKTFYVKPGTRLFACQNPLRQGGSRRGLPKSFLNRFTQVYIDSLSQTDLLIILESEFPQIPSDIRKKMVQFNSQLVLETESHKFGHKGSPWEFNLRDLTRWCQVILDSATTNIRPENSVFLIYGDRMRTLADKTRVREIFETVFGVNIAGDCPVPYITREFVYMGDVKIKRGTDGVNLSVLRQDKSCFVLRNQFQVLRSLMYCVNYNWMSILVGSSASGKSSAVRTLAQLTGSELRTLSVNSAMDTTDILGGFEQADYNRHLEEISSKIERYLLSVVQKCLLKSVDVQESTVLLLKKWEDYRNLQHLDTDHRTMADETKLFTKKLAKLNAILKALEETNKNVENFNVKNLLESLENLRKNVEKEGTLNAGGKFEWVDSILIKCLQDGCWLLIENVNLCSPAVLDRLNALLEPNGVLTIGERGVNENGEMVNIVPHPNFRLFLTIDPKNGEISRAMRNRGVEIYVLSENEIGNRNEFDTKALIGQNGIWNEGYQEILIQLHDYISNIVLGEKPTISHILQSSFLISQQLLRGISIFDSFVSSIVDVYVKTRSIHDFNMPEPILTIETQIKTTLRNYLDLNKTETHCNNHKTLKTIDLQINSDLEQIKQQSVLIQESSKIQNYVLLNYIITNLNNLQMRYLYLSKFLENDSVNLVLYETLNKLGKYNSGINLPLDSRWLPDTTESLITIPESNQVFLLLYYSMKKLEINSTLEPLNKKYKKLSVIQYSKAVFDKQLSQFSIQHPLIINFYNLLLNFDSFLLNLLKQIQFNLNSEDTIFAITTLNWRFVLQDIGDLIIYDKSDKHLSFNTILSQIIVRYKWFIKHTFNFFMKYSNTDISFELVKVIKLINASMENNFSNFNKIAKKFGKSYKRPLPLTDEKQIENLTKLQHISNQINLTVANTSNVQQKCDLLLNNLECRQIIYDTKKKLRSNEENVSENLIQIQNTINKSIKTELNNTELQLLPVTDYFGLIFINELRNHLILSTENKNLKLFSKIITIPIELNEIISTYCETKNEELLHELTFYIASYLKKSICLSPSIYLNWSNMNDEDFKMQYLSTHTPALCYSVSNICVSNQRDLVITANLGKFKDKSEQLRYLNELLWQNIPSIKSNLIKNDADYIINCFEQFLLILEKALTSENNSESIPNRIKVCTDEINKIYIQNPESDEMFKNKNKIIRIFEQLCHKINLLKTSQDFILETANVFCLLNYLKTILNSQLQVIDPLDKVVLKKKYYEEERIICTDLKKAFVSQNEIYSGNAKAIHPFCSILAEKINKYEIKEDELSKHVAVRPKNLTYQNLIKDVRHNLETLLSEEFFINMYEKLNKCILQLKEAVSSKTELNLEQANDVLHQSSSWLHSQENSYVKLIKFRVGYPDIIEPILSSITELSYGVKLLNTLLKKLLIQYEYKQHNLNVFMKNMIQFPVISETQQSIIDLIDLITHNKNINLVSQIIENENCTDLTKQENLRMLLCGIQEIYNLIIVSCPNYLEPCNEMLLYLRKLINLFVSAWYNQELERQNKLEEENSLYKTKSKCENLTEAEQNDKEMKQLFPNYHVQDFADFQQQQQLADDPPDTSLTDESDLTGVLTTDDVLFVANIHSELMLLYTKSEWLNPKKKHLEPDYITPFLQRFKLFNQLQSKIVDGLDSNLDKNIVVSLNLLVSVTKSYGEGTDLFNSNNSSPRKVKEKNYDFYKDSKVEEVKSCLHILGSLNIRIKELLNDWPEHPTLRAISTIIERVYSFPITSPVSRFLTGLEVLLSKCNEWEENAHSGVTLSEYSQNITFQIITWRKLELAGWKDCLNNAFERTRNSVSKWWFHIYSTIQQFVNTDSKPDETTSTTGQIIKVFQEFMEKSPLGEYETRLGLLYSFHCHTLYLLKSEKSEIIITILWNLWNYYNQFVSNIDTKIKNLRTPIEKKLKDFVKIARWNDINYWSIKETVEKTHRTLHKYIKEFENVLKQGVTDCLVNTSTETTEQVGIWDRPLRHTPSQYHYNLDPSNYMASVKFKKLLTQSQDENSLSNKSEKYFLKSRNLCKSTISNTTYPTLIQNLDSFITEVIETSNHLRTLEVNKELIKKKQISQAKSILQQKRKALADLFKSLTKCGLSYRTGIIETKLRENSDREFLLKPLDVKASFSYVQNKSACDRHLLNVWDGCETYFMRTISRFVALEHALKQPAKDLGIQNIERCKGFAGHLMILTQDQKSKLIDSTRNLYYLRTSLHQLSDLNEESDIISSDTIKKIIDFLTNIIIIMEQYKIILLSCPEQSTFSEDLLDIPILDEENEMLIKHRNDSNWSKSLSDIKIIITNAQKLKTTVEKLEFIFPATEIKIESPEFLFIQDKSNIVTELNNIKNKITNLETQFGNHSLSDSLKWISKEFNYILELIQTEYRSEHSDNLVGNFKTNIEKLMENILLVIQNIYKKYPTKPNKTDDNQETDVDQLFEENHIKDLIIDNLFSDISTLEIKSVFRKVKKLIGKLYKMNPEEAIECKSILINCVPLLEQIVLLYQYFVTQQIAAYRVTCKMCSVLLNIFIELASKGFCVPPELSDELDAEGQTNQQAGGMGLGEGEGEKDVSDRIESEDQLDDAQPAGQEKKNEDKDCKEDNGIEMSEDFEGKLQDKEKPEEDDESQSSDSDAEKQMGDTEPDADKLDQQIWGSDDEENEDENEPEQSENQDKEERGDGGEVEDQQMGAKEDKPESKQNEEDDQQSTDKQKEQQKDINEMDEPEYDEDQTDPYHGNQPQLPEPEPMDLPDDLQLDDGEEKEEQNEENPFDIDNMKDQQPPEDQPDDEKKVEETDENKSKEEDSSDDENESPEKEDNNEDNLKEQEDLQDETDDKETEGLKNKQDTEEQKDDVPEENKDSAFDNQQSKEDDIQPMDIDNIETADNVETNPNQTNAQTADKISQEQSHDQEGVGQSQMEESESGHRGEVNATKDSLNAQKEKEIAQEKRQRPGESDSKRSLGETAEPIKKKMKTIDIQDKDGDDNEDVDNEGAKEDGKDADIYQHIKEAKESDTQVMDAATKEQAETQKIENLDTDDKEEDATDELTEMMDTDEPEADVTDTQQQKPEKTDTKSEKKTASKQQGDIVDEIKDVEIEGEVVDTSTVQRGNETTYHTQYELMSESQVERLSTIQIQDLRTELETQLGTWNEPPPNIEAEQTWEKFSAITSSLARDLSEQLRLVLEPTQASRLRGDFRTGRRINMRKVIPYIASQFRKDKIWLRRTKPSKREYQIVLAIDDSSSMDDNHSKELAFESVALISKALSLLESGQLSVLSFGESTEILHKLTDTFTEKSGVKLLQKFQFTQKKTCVANLVDFVTTMFSDVHTTAMNAKLLIVVSDGRGIFSEGETFVQQAIRRAKFADIFMVFVIIDNPENKSSILDIRMPVFKDGQLLGIKSYLDSFPFPFYIILRDINSLPSVLSDALRQWFELVTNVD